MNGRLEEIFSAIEPCKIFADIGCDHGLMTEAVLRSGKCQKAVVSDVSKKCLEKAENLLKNYIDEGRVSSVVSDGFDNLPEVDLALIAGMGGEEISLILKKAKNLPDKLVLQQMKNVDKVRTFAVELGYKIKKDYVFYFGKVYYDLLVLEKGEDKLTEEEIEFGRTNLEKKGEAFISRLKIRMEKLNGFLQNPSLSEESKEQMREEILRLKKYV
jgi:tRNA (adenine22-N1)-methyltransferase